jgi:DNA-binding protein H-NS
MTTYQAIRAQIAKLEKKAQDLRRNELRAVVARVKKIIDEYGLTAADLGLGHPKALRGRRRAGATVGVPKYRDPKTGKTWTGRGKPPAWIAGARNRDAFLIDTAAAPAKPAPKAAAKRGKPAAKKKARAAAKKPAGRRRGRALAPVRTPAVEIESGVATE